MVRCPSSRARHKFTTVFSKTTSAQSSTWPWISSHNTAPQPDRVRRAQIFRKSSLGTAPAHVWIALLYPCYGRPSSGSESSRAITSNRPACKHNRFPPKAMNPRLRCPVLPSRFCEEEPCPEACRKGRGLVTPASAARLLVVSPVRIFRPRVKRNFKLRASCGDSRPFGRLRARLSACPRQARSLAHRCTPEREARGVRSQ